MLTFKNIFVYTKFVATLMSDHNTFPSDLRSCQTYYVQTYRNSYKILCYFSGVYWQQLHMPGNRFLFLQFRNSPESIYFTNYILPGQLYIQKYIFRSVIKRFQYQFCYWVVHIVHVYCIKIFNLQALEEYENVCPKLPLIFFQVFSNIW